MNEFEEHTHTHTHTSLNEREEEEEEEEEEFSYLLDWPIGTRLGTNRCQKNLSYQKPSRLCKLRLDPFFPGCCETSTPEP